MKTRFYTTIEESRKLLELGLSAETADMHYIDDDEELIRVGWDNYPPDAEHLPAWSLGALLDAIYFPAQTTRNYKKARVDIIYKEGFTDNIHSEEAKTLIEALIQTIVWLLENNYIKKG